MEKQYAAPILQGDEAKIDALAKEWGLSKKAALEKVLCEYKHIGGTEFKRVFRKPFDDVCSYVALTEKAAAMLKNWEHFYNAKTAFETFHHILKTRGSD